MKKEPQIISLINADIQNVTHTTFDLVAEKLPPDKNNTAFVSTGSILKTYYRVTFSSNPDITDGDHVLTIREIDKAAKDYPNKTGRIGFITAKEDAGVFCDNKKRATPKELAEHINQVLKGKRVNLKSSLA